MDSKTIQNGILAAVIAFVLSVCVIASAPVPSYAAKSMEGVTYGASQQGDKVSSSGGSQSSNLTHIMLTELLGRIRTMVNVFGIPMATIITGWRIVYLLLICGIMGIDPLNMMPDESRNWTYIWTRVKFHMTGFVKGIAWIAGAAVLFNLIVSIVSAIANQL